VRCYRILWALSALEFHTCLYQLLSYRCKTDPVPARDREVDPDTQKPIAPRRKFIQFVGWSKKQCSWEVADGSELDVEDLVGQEIHITSSDSNRGALATITTHCGGSVYAITSEGDTIADCEVDLLLPKGVKWPWSKWRVAAAVEYDSDGSGSDASGSESEGDPSGSDEPAIACNVHDNSTQEMELEPNDSDE